MDGAKSCRFRTDFVQISVQNLSDLCSKSDSNLSNVSSASSHHKILNYLRALPKMHIEFERKSTRFLSDFDQASVPNLNISDFCSKSDSNLCNVSSASSPLKLLNCIGAVPKIHIVFERKSTRFLSDFDQICV